MKKGFRKSIILAAGLTVSLTFATSVSADTIKVQSGDTLYGLSHKYNVSVSKIKSANGLSSNTIYTGQSLSIPTATTKHTVRSGETLWSISKKYGTSVQNLKNLNNLSSNTIYPGQTLTVSGQASSSTTSSSYKVKSGDTLWSLSRQFNVSVSNIKSWNGLSSNTIYPGQTLKLQAGSSVKTPAPSQSSLTDNIIADAKSMMGTPYVWGGSTPNGFDCSGFLNYVFAKNGVNISRTVATIYNEGKSVSSPERGDIVFFETYNAGPSHAGIYLGNGQFIHASSSQGVTISSMDNSYWKPRYLGAKSYF